MKLHPPALTVLALFVGLPALGAADAEAASIGRGVVKLRANTLQGQASYRVATTVSGDDDAVATVSAELESDAGEEELPLVESDAWLHGAATITGLPSVDATVTLTLYDSDSVALGSTSGTLDAAGRLATGWVDWQSPVWENEAADRASAADSSGDTADIEVLAVEAFASAAGYALAFDLAGADTYAVAYASITITEPGEQICIATDEKGNCLKWETTKESSTRAEVFWDDIGSVWEGDVTLAHEGLLDLEVIAYDARGKKLETARSKVGAPWSDGGEGVNTLATDEDPLTRLALRTRRDGSGGIEHAASLSRQDLTIVSDGWASGDALPVAAQVELTGGGTITIPVNSYQRRAHYQEHIDATMEAEIVASLAGRYTTHLQLRRNASPEPLELDVPYCEDGLCVTVVEAETGGYELATTAYGDDASALPDEAEVVVSLVDERGVARATYLFPAIFDETIAAVFANEVSFAGDPTGLGLSGRVTLLGEANRKGKQETLAKGKFHGSFSRDGDGDLELAGADKDGVVSSGDAVIAGEAVFLTDREGAPVAPPAIQYGNGSGTRNASHQASVKPQLL